MSIFQIPTRSLFQDRKRDRVHLATNGNLNEALNTFTSGIREISSGLDQYNFCYSPDFIYLVTNSANIPNAIKYMSDVVEEYMFEAVSGRTANNIESLIWKTQDLRDATNAYNGLILFARKYKDNNIDELLEWIDDLDVELTTLYPIGDDSTGYWPRHEYRIEILRHYLSNLQIFSQLRILNLDELSKGFALGFAKEMETAMARPRYADRLDENDLQAKLTHLANLYSVPVDQIRTEIIISATSSVYTMIGTETVNFDDPRGYTTTVEKLGGTRDDVIKAYTHTIPRLLDAKGNHIHRLISILDDLSDQEVQQLYQTDDMFSINVFWSIRSYFESDSEYLIYSAITVIKKLKFELQADQKTELINLIDKRIIQIISGERYGLEIAKHFIELGILTNGEIESLVARRIAEQPELISELTKTKLDIMIENIMTIGINFKLIDQPYINMSVFSQFIEFENKRLTDLITIIRRHKTFSHIIQIEDYDSQITPELFDLIDSGPFLTYEIEIILQFSDKSADEIILILESENYFEIYKLLIQFVPPWVEQPHSVINSDILRLIEQNVEDYDNFGASIREPLEDAMIFFGGTERISHKGVKKMWKYMSRKDVTRHDMLQSISQIIRLATDVTNIFGHKPRRFYGDILFQVQLDRQPYNDGLSSYHEFNRIAEGFDINVYLNMWDSIIDTTNEHNELVITVRKLLADFESPADAFISWKNLKAAFKALNIFSSQGILLKINKIKQDSPDLADFLIELLKHPEVSLRSINDMVDNPRRYLGGDNPLMPASYITIPGLDWNYHDIVRAIHSPKIERVKSMPSISVRYTVLVPPNCKYWLEEFMKLASDNLELIVSHLPLEWGITSFEQLLSATRDTQFVNSDLLTWIRNNWHKLSTEIFSDWIMLDLTASQANKSSAIAQLGGNDTNSCMAFGRAKTVQYISTLGFGIKIIMIDEVDRELPLVITQSVSTEDILLPQGVDPFDLHAAMKKGKSLIDLVPELILYDTPRVLADDNIEVRRRYATNPQLEHATRIVYELFSHMYRDQFAETMGYSPDLHVLGRHADDELNQKPNASNTTIPGCPMIYSDKTGSQVIRFDEYDSSIPTNIINVEVENMEEPNHRKEYRQYGEFSSRQITYSDALQLAYLSERSGEHISIHDIQSSLNGTGTYAAFRDLQNLLGNVILDSEGKIISFSHYYLTDSKDGTQLHRRWTVVHPEYSDKAKELEEIYQMEITYLLAS